MPSSLCVAISICCKDLKFWVNFFLSINDRRLNGSVAKSAATIFGNSDGGIPSDSNPFRKAVSYLVYAPLSDELIHIIVALIRWMSWYLSTLYPIDDHHGSIERDGMPLSYSKLGDLTRLVFYKPSRMMAFYGFWGSILLLFCVVQGSILTLNINPLIPN